jgi:hypothetical protein
MPEYKFRNNDTGKEWLERMGISEADLFLENNPNIERLVHGFPMLHSGTGLGGGLKVDRGFNDILKNIKKEHSRGITQSTVETK